MQNQGYVDSKKHQDCIRLLSLNPHGFGLDNEEKIEMMVLAAQKYDIDRIMLSSLDRRQTSSRIDKVKRKFKKISREIAIITSDSE